MDAALTLPWLRVWLAIPPTIFLTARKVQQEIFGFPFRLISCDGGARPESKSGRCSVSSALPHIAFQKAEGARRTFQRGHLQITPKTCIFAAQLLFFGDFRTRKTRSERIHSLQASQNELAEPFKYSNSLHTSSTMVCCIPNMRASNLSKMLLQTGVA
jgi:hypothetical protein